MTEARALSAAASLLVVAVVLAMVASFASLLIGWPIDQTVEHDPQCDSCWTVQSDADWNYYYLQNP